MPDEDRTQKIRTRIVYGTRWMKYGAINLVTKLGRTSASKTTALGTLGPTRSRAADNMMT